MLNELRRPFQKWANFKNGLKRSGHWSYVWVEIAEALGVAAAVVLLVIRPYFIQVSVVPTGSMIPTIQKQDRLFVLKFFYRFFDPERGDIIVFESPTGEGPDFVKRCVAIPGDRIEINNGVVYVNGAMLRFPGVIMLRDMYDMDPITIPEGKYFMMGDNRAYSSDSRMWGFVERSEILGKAYFTFWPLNRMQVLY